MYILRKESGDYAFLEGSGGDKLRRQYFHIWVISFQTLLSSNNKAVQEEGNPSNINCIFLPGQQPGFHIHCGLDAAWSHFNGDCFDKSFEEAKLPCHNTAHAKHINTKGMPGDLKLKSAKCYCRPHYFYTNILKIGARKISCL